MERPVGEVVFVSGQRRKLEEGPSFFSVENRKTWYPEGLDGVRPDGTIVAEVMLSGIWVVISVVAVVRLRSRVNTHPSLPSLQAIGGAQLMALVGTAIVFACLVIAAHAPVILPCVLPSIIACGLVSLRDNA